LILDFFIEKLDGVVKEILFLLLFLVTYKSNIVVNCISDSILLQKELHFSRDCKAEIIKVGKIIRGLSKF